jgi:hypothetical protein
MLLQKTPLLLHREEFLWSFLLYLRNLLLNCLENSKSLIVKNNENELRKIEIVFLLKLLNLKRKSARLRVRVNARFGSLPLICGLHLQQFCCPSNFFTLLAIC